MRKPGFFLVAALLFYLPCHASLAQTAPQEYDTSYGRKGIRELGLNGSIILPSEFTIDGETDDDGTTSVVLQPFFKYFFQDRMHAGAQLMIQSSTQEQESGIDNVTNVTVFSPHIGYSLPLSPRLQLDGQLNLGFFSIENTALDLDESALSWGFNFMVLAPISESAVIGTGLILTWTSIEVESMTVDIFSRLIPIQVSFYF